MSSKSSTAETMMTSRYVRLALDHFGVTPDLRRAILERTGISETALEDSAYRVSIGQQSRQHDNLTELFGEAWAVSAPELWSTPTFGLLSVASQMAEVDPVGWTGIDRV